jgi:LPS export ABC transporter protein LptC
MKEIFKRHWPLLGLAFLVALVVFYLTKSAEEIVQEPVAKGIMSGEGLQLKDIHYTHDDPYERLKWVMDAKEVKFSEDRSLIIFHDFQLKLAPEKRKGFNLKGKKGEYSRDSGELKLWGDLKGVSEDGYRINTEYVLINEKSGQVRTDKPVKIFGPFFSIEGKGLFVDLEKDRFKVLSDVTTIVEKEPLI